MPRWLGLLSSLIAISLVVLAAACDDDEGAPGGVTPGAETPTVAAETPTVAAGPGAEITTPADGSTVPAGDVQVSVSVSGFEIVNRLGEPAVEGEGHVHFYLDVSEIPTTPGQPAVTAEGTYHAEATTSYSWPDVQPGEHTLAVQLVNNDHTPLDPPVTAEVTVTVQ